MLLSCYFFVFCNFLIAYSKPMIIIGNKNIIFDGKWIVFGK